MTREGMLVKHAAPPKWRPLVVRTRDEMLGCPDGSIARLIDVEHEGTVLERWQVLGQRTTMSADQVVAWDLVDETWDELLQTLPK